jgi:hypothetical protein
MDSINNEEELVQSLAKWMKQSQGAGRIVSNKNFF